MEKISINDIIFATAKIQGRVMASLRLSGIMSMADIIREIKKEIGSASGLLTISLRNMTQGWSRQKSVYLSAIPIRNNM